MSRTNDVAQKIIEAAEAAVPGLTGERGFRPIETIAADEMPHLFVFNPSETNTQPNGDQSMTQVEVTREYDCLYVSRDQTSDVDEDNFEAIKGAIGNTTDLVDWKIKYGLVSAKQTLEHFDENLRLIDFVVQTGEDDGMAL